MIIFCDYCGEYHSTQNCPYNLDAYGYMEDQNWNQQQNFSWYDQNAQNFLYANNFAAAADMPWQYQSSHEHSNPLEQTFPTSMTSFDRLLEEMQELNKSMEARLEKMDERMINWGGSTSTIDNIPKGTEIPRQEVREQYEENPSMPTHHARAGVTANAWAEIATGSNATTTSHDAAKSDASANSTESDAENDTITLMLKHEPINCSHPQFSRQPCGIKETTCPGSNYTFCLGSEEVVCHGNEELACPGSIEATCLGSPEVARPGSRQAVRPSSTEAVCPGSTEAACPGSTEATCLGSPEVACPSSRQAACPGNTEAACLGSEEPVCPGSTEATCPGSRETAHPGSKRTTRPEFCHGGEQNDCFVSTSLSDMMTDYLENEAHSMVIPPTICAAPQSLLMEMFKKSEDNDTWKIDDFKKNVPSIDFQRILAKDYHGTIARWSEYRNFNEKGHKNISTVAAQREVAEIPLAQVFLDEQLSTLTSLPKFLPRHITSPKFLPTIPAVALPPKIDLARRIDRSKRRRLTFMAYPRDFNKAIIQVIKDKFPEFSTRSQCLNKNLPTSLPWHHIPTRQNLNYPPRAYFPAEGQKTEQQI
ncbi:hypothetical protein V6N11_067639 [Hibiscus sabdariffa]|uniref:Uncharacterized protein n=1 Tax=Hibiscus sabdariffa TaxID=183260 RepID=A0ABR2SSB9_9ROSI